MVLLNRVYKHSGLDRTSEKVCRKLPLEDHLDDRQREQRNDHGRAQKLISGLAPGLE